MSDDESPIRQREDLSNRYEQGIDIQTTAIQNFDQKTWRILRVTGIIVSAGVAVLSFLLNQRNNNQIFQQPGIQLVLSVAVICFIGTFVLGIRSYQSSKLFVPPWPELGSRISENLADFDEYESTLLDSYITARKRNKKVLSNKRKRFRESLYALFLGIWCIGIAFLLLLWTPTNRTSYCIIIALLILGLILGYLTLYYEEDYNSEADGENGESDAADDE